MTDTKPPCGGDEFECWMNSCPESIRHDMGAPEHEGYTCADCAKSTIWDGKCDPALGKSQEGATREAALADHQAQGCDVLGDLLAQQRAATEAALAEAAVLSQRWESCKDCGNHPDCYGCDYSRIAAPLTAAHLARYRAMEKVADKAMELVRRCDLGYGTIDTASGQLVGIHQVNAACFRELDARLVALAVLPEVTP